jgi:hypothetical protein
MSIQEKLKDIQQKLVAPKAKYNSFGKYQYRSCEDILEAIKPLLGDATLILNDDIVGVGERVYVKAMATLTLGDKQVCANGFAREAVTKKGMDDAQITGAASSYARKYALNGLFCIDDNEDADKLNTSVEPEIIKEINAIDTVGGLNEFFRKHKPSGGVLTVLAERKAEINANS